MSTPPLKQIGQQARHLLRQVSGASRAVATAEHTAEHLQNVERWAQHEFLVQRQLHESRLVELERRVAKLEKAQNALAAAGAPDKAPKPSDAHDVVRVTPAYYRRWETILSEVAQQCDVFTQVSSTFEIYSGAAKSCTFLADRVKQYVGFEPSEVLRNAAGKRTRDSRFAFVNLEEAISNPIEADLVLLLAEKQRWSIFDMDRMVELAASKLTVDGRIVLHIPFSLREMRLAGWHLSMKLESLDLLPLRELVISGSGACMLIGRTGDV